jgi:hypothetical protein
MNRNMAFVALAAIPGLTACGDRSGENAAIDQNVLQASQEDVLSNDAGNISASAPIENVDTATPSEAPESPRGEEAPVPKNESSAERDDGGRPPPEAPRPQPEPDPHAGHDMNNMAEMSHD